MYKGGTMHAILPVAFHSDRKSVYKMASYCLLLHHFLIQLKCMMKDIIIQPHYSNMFKMLLWNIIFGFAILTNSNILIISSNSVFMQLFNMLKFSILIGRSKKNQQISNSNFKIGSFHEIGKLLKNKRKERVMVQSTSRHSSVHH